MEIPQFKQALKKTHNTHIHIHNQKGNNKCKPPDFDSE